MDNDEYVLLLADIHANKAALEEVISDAKNRYRQHGHLKIWFLGDLFGRGPDPAISWQILMDIPPEVTIVGNHDWGLIGRHKDIKLPSGKWAGKFNSHDWEGILEHRRQLQNVGLLTLDSDEEPQGGLAFETLKSWPVVWVPRPGVYLVHGGLDDHEKIEIAVEFKVEFDSKSLHQIFEQIPQSQVHTTLFDSCVWGYTNKFEYAQYTIETLQWLYENWSEVPELRATPDTLQAPKLILVGHYHRRTLYFSPDASGWVEPVKLDHTYELHAFQEQPILISPGGVGFPREIDERDKDGSYAVLHLKDQVPHSIRFHKASFDRQAVIERMEKNKYLTPLTKYLQTPGETET